MLASAPNLDSFQISHHFLLLAILSSVVTSAERYYPCIFRSLLRSEEGRTKARHTAGLGGYITPLASLPPKGP